MTGTGGTTDIEVGKVSPDPTDEEMAAIVAAIQLAWPEPAGEPVTDQTTRWRFSGRWWSKPVPTRRDRPR